MAWILWILGLLFIFLEFYTPGAIMATIGVCLLIASLVSFFASASAWASLLFFIGMALSVGFVIKYALWRIPRTKSGFSIYSNDDQAGYKASSFDSAMIGKEGVALTDLRPGGYVLIEGQKQAVISQSGYIQKGVKVRVIGGEGDNLIVQYVNINPSNG